MRYRGGKWLDDVLTEVADTMLQNRAFDISRQGLEKVGRGSVAAISVIVRGFLAIQTKLGKLFTSCGSSRSKSDGNGSILPVSNTSNSGHNSNGNNSREGSAKNVNTYGRKSSETVLALQTNALGLAPGSPRSPSIGSLEKSPTTESSSAMPFPIRNTVSAGKQRWREAFRAVRIRAAIADPDSTPVVVGTPRAPSRRRTTSSNLTDRRRAHTPMKGAIAKSRLADLVPRLKVLEATQDLAAHTALVKHLQFSPDGKYLATSR